MINTLCALQYANKLCSEEKYNEAYYIYKRINEQFPEFNSLFDINMDYCATRCNNINDVNFQLTGGEILKKYFAIDQVYLLYLDSHKERLVKAVMEMNRYGIEVRPFPGIDGKRSRLAKKNLEEYKKNDVRVPTNATRHLSFSRRNMWKQKLTPAVFAYLHSQLAILKDALKKEYKKILIFDDDVYFCNFFEAFLLMLHEKLPSRYKICHLGVSEYNISKKKIDRSFLSIYNPVSPFTCGSFAVIYDREIIPEIIKALTEFSGPYDIVTLGHIYSLHPHDCFAPSKSLCCPDVTHSLIMDDRDNKKHSNLMLWDTKYYDRFNKSLKISIILNKKVIIDEIDISNKLHDSDLNINFYKKDKDSIIQRIEEKEIKNSSGFMKIDALWWNRIKKEISDSDILQNSITILWPDGIKLSSLAILETVCSILMKYNKEKLKDSTSSYMSYIINIKDLN